MEFQTRYTGVNVIFPLTPSAHQRKSSMGRRDQMDIYLLPVGELGFTQPAFSPEISN
ncbi:hypothetical protein DPMN_093819 [Dreissena polymorpha]|uniref:Uncharacterized protein n=1 Tax=Dreissena polymorpha TaxID=45954 RepID=A0A9D4R1D1_DREPO|nr:hypothetical protein DPMN_093819 [Dreissena polymorpha]